MKNVFPRYRIACLWNALPFSIAIVSIWIVFKLLYYNPIICESIVWIWNKWERWIIDFCSQQCEHIIACKLWYYIASSIELVRTAINSTTGVYIGFIYHVVPTQWTTIENNWCIVLWKTKDTLSYLFCKTTMRQFSQCISQHCLVTKLSKCSNGESTEQSNFVTTTQSNGHNQMNIWRGRIL